MKKEAIQKRKEEGYTAGKIARGCDLREISKFLKEKDDKGTFIGLGRVCNEQCGKAIWVTDATAKQMKEENKVKQPKAELSDLKQNERNESAHGETEAMSRLKEELQRQAGEIVGLKQKIETLEETCEENSPGP